MLARLVNTTKWGPNISRIHIDCTVQLMCLCYHNATTRPRHSQVEGEFDIRLDPSSSVRFKSEFSAGIDHTVDLIGGPNGTSESN